MGTQIKIREFTFVRYDNGRANIYTPEHEVLEITPEEAIELASFLAGGLDIYAMFMAGEMTNAYRGEEDLKAAQAVHDYNLAVINACARLELCAECQAQVKIDVKKQARKVRELNELLFEEIRKRIEGGKSAYSQIMRSTKHIMSAMKGVENICEQCHAKQHELIRKEFFRIRMNEAYRVKKGQ